MAAGSTTWRERPHPLAPTVRPPRPCSGDGSTTLSKNPVWYTICHRAPTMTIAASRGHASRRTDLARDNLLHLLDQVLVYARDDRSQSRIVEPPGPRRGDGQVLHHR